MQFVNPFPTPFWRMRKNSRSVWRQTHNMNKRRTHHGGRGKKYGLKGGKQRKSVR